MLLPYLICVLFNPLTENGDLGHHQDFVKRKRRDSMPFDGGANSPRNRQACWRALHVSHNVLFRNKLLRQNFHLTFSVGMKIKLVHQGGGPPGVKYNRDRLIII